MAFFGKTNGRATGNAEAIERLNASFGQISSSSSSLVQIVDAQARLVEAVQT